jgi:hypothetical protein
MRVDRRTRDAPNNSKTLVARYPNSNRSIDGCFRADANVVLGALFQVPVDRATYKVGDSRYSRDCGPVGSSGLRSPSLTILTPS